MRRFLAAAVLAAAVAGVGLGGRNSWAAAPEAPAAKDAKAQVPVRAVVLFSSGVGYFEHYGTVNGSGSTELRFKTQQINDILKSLVLQDLDGGHVSTISYPSQDPIAKTLRSFQVDITANPSLGELLNQLRGAKVKVKVTGEEIDGTILGLEKKQKPTGKDTPPVEVWVLNLIAGGTIRAIDLDIVQKIDLEDPELRDEMNKALLALSQARDQDKKPVTINFDGKGERHLRVGYVVETPVWKTSYRLLLSGEPAADPKEAKSETANPEPAQPAAAGKNTLQGWAIVENQTDNDWNGVELSLVSGRPISFIEDLYQPLYVPRPVVRPQLYASLAPQTYEGGMQPPPEAPASFGARAEADAAGNGAMAGESRMRRALGRDGAREMEFAAKSASAAPAKQPMDPSASIANVASAAKIGELFQYTVGSVSLPRQRSAMIPILNDALEVEKLSIYNQRVLSRNPLNGARLKNTTAKHLLQGPVTVFDGGGYAGDASIDNVPPGQERLLSYGVDLQMLVDATKNKQESVIQSGKIVKGVLTVTYKHLFSQDYSAENKSDKDKMLIIEHPIRQGWSLVNTNKPIETTEALYRFKGKVPAGKSTKLTVQEEVVQGQEIAMFPADAGSLAFYAKSGTISQQVRDVLTHAVLLKNAMTDTQRQIQEHQQKLAKITQEQARMRENMRTVDTKSQYYNRLLTKLNDQESQIETLQGEIEALQKTAEQQRKDLEDYLGKTTVG